MSVPPSNYSGFIFVHTYFFVPASLLPEAIPEFKNHFGLDTSLTYVSQVGWNKHELFFKCGGCHNMFLKIKITHNLNDNEKYIKLSGPGIRAVAEIITPCYALVVTPVINENLIRNINWVTFAQKSINQFFQDVFNTIPHKNSHEVLGLLKHHFAAGPYIPIIP